MAHVTIRHDSSVRSELMTGVSCFLNTVCVDSWPLISRFAGGDATVIPEIAQLMLTHPQETLELLRGIRNTLGSVIEIHRCECVDLMPGRLLRDVDIVERAKLLKNTLVGMPAKYDRVLVESQSNILNFISSAVQDQLIMYYIDDNPKVVNPRRKNEHCFDDSLQHSVYAAKYKNLYGANKAHTRENFLYFSRVFGVDTSHIPRANMDDVADAFMQAIAYHYNPN